MMNKIKNPIVILTVLIFLFIFIYYAFINPVTLWNFDDWRYFGFFESDPVPRLGKWNITRLMPEYLMPLAGQFSAFFVYPIVGDYLAAAGITLAI